MKKSAIIIAAILVFAHDWAFAKSAKEIIEASENAMRSDSQISLIIVTIKTPRWTRSMKLKNWDYRAKKQSLSEILSPAKDAGNRFLLLNNTMYHYVPKLQQEIKISPSMMLQSWMGSDFTNDDIVKESSVIEDYTHELVGEKTFDGARCHKIVLIPKKDAAVVWGRIIYYARADNNLPARKEFYNEHGVLKKVMIFGDYKVMDGRLIPASMKMESVGKKDRYTLLEIKNVKFNARIGPEIMTIQNLKRR